MAPPKLTATSRYFPPGTRKYYWLTAVAAQASPTRAEMNAGTDLSDEVADVAGFTVTSDQIEVPDLSGRFAAKIPGRITADDSSITFYASVTSADVRAVLPRDTTGFMLILPEGDVPTQKMDVFPAKVAAASIDPSIADPGRVVVSFSITKAPSQNVTIPA